MKISHRFILAIAVLLAFSVNLYSQVTDIDGNAYKTVTIGKQVWTAENLNVTKYQNGDPIPQCTDLSEWAKLKTGAWCYYKFDSENGKVYGKLYNWYAVADPRGLAPKGWHVPSKQEWSDMIDALGGDAVVGGKLKATTLWADPNTEATNESGFTALPGGSLGFENTFGYQKMAGMFWTSTEITATTAAQFYLVYEDAVVFRVDNNKKSGLSVRCVKD
jgi:uncharacterized protein (TIGR02145 family)